MTRFCTTLTALLCLATLATAAHATTVCVHTAQELHAALAAAERNGAADVIRLAAGTYEGEFYYTSPEPFGLTLKGGYDATCTTRQGYPENTVLQPDEDTDTGRPLLWLRSIKVFDVPFVIEGLTIQYAYATNHPGAGLLVKTNGGHVTLRQNLLQYNVLSGEGHTGGGLGIEYAGQILLVGNTLRGNSCHGAKLNGGTYILRHNLFVDNDYEALVLAKGVAVTLKYNTFLGNGGHPIVGIDPATARLKGNTIQDPDPAPIPSHCITE